MMAYLKGSALPKVKVHKQYQDFSKSLDKAIHDFSPDASRMVNRYGVNNLKDALDYNLYASGKDLQKSLDMKAKYAKQDYAYGMKIVGADLDGQWQFGSEVENVHGGTRLTAMLYGGDSEEGYITFDRLQDSLVLQSEQRQTLPGTISGIIDNKDETIPTMAYLGQMAIRQLVDKPEDIKTFKVSLLQHQETIAHVDWLIRNNKADNIAEALPHTAWFQRIKGMIAMAGLDIKGEPEVISKADNADQSEFDRRSWDAITESHIHGYIDALTGRMLPPLRQQIKDWKPKALQAIKDYKEDLDKYDKKELTENLDRLALHAKNMEMRYDLPEQGSIAMDFDVVFKVEPSAQAAPRRSTRKRKRDEV